MHNPCYQPLYFFTRCILVFILSIWINSSWGLQKNSKYRGDVSAMCGLGLGISTGPSGMRQLKNRVDRRFQVPSFYTRWFRVRQVSHDIATRYKKDCPIILMGHSLGASKQIEVARLLAKRDIPVALLVTTDSVFESRVPANVQEVLNIYQNGHIPFMIGLKLKADNPKRTRIHNLNTDTIQGIRVTHLSIDNNKVVQNIILKKVATVLASSGTVGRNYRKKI